MPQNNIHEPFSTALKLFNITLKEWSKNRIKPDGALGVHPSMVIRCAKGREDSEWLRTDIEQLIEKAHETFPDFYAYHNKEKAAS